VSESTSSSGDRNPGPFAKIGYLERFVDGDACTQDWSCLGILDIFWETDEVVGVGQCILRKTPLDILPGDLSVGAEVFVARRTWLAQLADLVQPADGNTISNLPDFRVSVWAEGYNGASSFVAANRDAGLEVREIAASKVQVRCADTGIFHLYQHLA
jgi:hypothetical protein